MSDLTEIDKRYLEKILGMQSGWLLDYTDPTFGQLFNRYNINIHSQNDQIDISDVIDIYDLLTDSISDFVQITNNGANSILSIDVDGGADNFVQIAQINGVTGLTDEDALENSGTLIV